jgi:PfaD family protein
MNPSAVQDLIHPIRFHVNSPLEWGWNGPEGSVVFDDSAVRAHLAELDQPAFLVRQGDRVGVTNAGAPGNGSGNLLAWAPPYSADLMGDPAFRETYGLKYAYMAGAMANAIASERMVIELGKAGMLGSFGSAGVVPSRLEGCIQRIQAALPDGPYAFNLIHSPSEEAMERHAVDLFLQYGVTTVEASAFLGLTPNIVYYRVSGLSQNPDGEILIRNRVIAKVSRREVAIRFIEPAPAKILAELVSQGKITDEQAALAARVPMADDITLEADSGGHTDNRPLVCLVPSMLALRDEVQEKYQYTVPVRIGAAGGISTPEAALGAFMMGAAYVVTGSINQACTEAGASEYTRKQLAEAVMTDVTMAPAADMFEMGVRVQVLKKGTFFPMRASKLYELYSRYDSIEAIPADEREKLEKTVLKRGMDEIWEECVRFFSERDPDQIARAHDNPKRKMALIFRWYLGLSSRWSNSGEPGREMDYQIWCGPAIGPFNDWTRGTYLADPANRKVVDVALHLLTGAAYQYRIRSLQSQGAIFPVGLDRYQPFKPIRD